MIRCPDGSADRDIVRWLSNVFMHGEPPTPYRLVHVGDGIVSAYRVGDPMQRVKAFPYRECFAHWPTLGCFNMRGSRKAVYIGRKTLRQWTRSLSAELIYTSPLDLLGRDRVPTAAVVEIPYLHDPYMTADDAVTSILTERRISSAITPRVSVGGGPCTCKAALFIDGQFAGTVYDKLVTVHSALSIPHISKVFGDSYVVREA